MFEPESEPSPHSKGPGVIILNVMITNLGGKFLFIGPISYGSYPHMYHHISYDICIIYHRYSACIEQIYLSSGNLPASVSLVSGTTHTTALRLQLMITWIWQLGFGKTLGL